MERQVPIKIDIVIYVCLLSVNQKRKGYLIYTLSV